MDKSTLYTTNAICPYCGDEDRDSWELTEGECECGNCGELFTMMRIVTVEYSTYKKDPREKELTP